MKLAFAHLASGIAGASLFAVVSALLLIDGFRKVGRKTSASDP